MKTTSDFDIRKADSGLVERLKKYEGRGKKIYKLLYKFCEDVDYYIDRGMSEKDAIGYVKYWYRKNKRRKK